MAVSVYTKSGSKSQTPAKLNKNIFGVDAKDHQLLKDAYLSYMAVGRSVSAKTKKRGEVRGGGRKPYRQKGTGNARFGSTRNPIWTGGGVAFGPTGDENYSRKLNLKSKRLALKQALTMASKENRLSIIDDVSSTDGKVKSMSQLLAKVGAKEPTLLVVDHKNDMLIRSTKNLRGVELLQANYLNVYQLMNARSILITKKALEILDGWLGSKKITKKADDE